MLERIRRPDVSPGRIAMVTLLSDYPVLLGVMLSMGYTSKDLMFQSALKIMPAVLIAAVIGTIGGSVLFTAIMSKAFGKFIISKLLIIVTAILLAVFCFVSAYIGSAKIKKISVTELMTE